MERPTDGIERVTLAEVHEYRALMLEAYAAHPDAFIPTPEERAAAPLAFWEARLSPEPRPRELVLGAYVGGALAGVVGVSFEAREKLRHRCTFFGMYVRARDRGQGLASRLITAALAVAAARDGCLVAQLTLLAPNVAARVLYEKHGFQVYGVEPLGVRVGEVLVERLYMWRAAGSL